MILTPLPVSVEGWGVEEATDAKATPTPAPISARYLLELEAPESSSVRVVPVLGEPIPLSDRFLEEIEVSSVELLDEEDDNAGDEPTRRLTIPTGPSNAQGEPLASAPSPWSQVGLPPPTPAARPLGTKAGTPRIINEVVAQRPTPRLQRVPTPPSSPAVSSHSPAGGVDPVPEPSPQLDLDSAPSASVPPARTPAAGVPPARTPAAWRTAREDTRRWRTAREDTRRWRAAREDTRRWRTAREDTRRWRTAREDTRRWRTAREDTRRWRRPGVRARA